MTQWRVVESLDDFGYPLWSLEYKAADGLWREDRVFRDRDMALADHAYLEEPLNPTFWGPEPSWWRVLYARLCHRWRNRRRNVDTEGER